MNFCPMKLSQNGSDVIHRGMRLTYVLPGFVSAVIFQSCCLEGYKECNVHPKQPPEEVIKLQMGLQRKHY